MADEAQYASGPDAATNKRKYGDQTPPPPSSGTGFSTPIASQSPDSGDAPSSHSSVPPPGDDVQVVMRRSKEISARLLSKVKAKSPSVKNSGGCLDWNNRQKRNFSKISPSSIPFSFSYCQPDKSKKFHIRKGGLRVLVSRETIDNVIKLSGVRIEFTLYKTAADPNSPIGVVELMGTPEQIAKAESLIDERPATEIGGGRKRSMMKIPKSKEFMLTGKQGATISSIRAGTGAGIQVIPSDFTPEEISEIIVMIDGTSEQIDFAKQWINGVIYQKRNCKSDA